MKYSFPRMHTLYITIVLWLLSAGLLPVQKPLAITPVTVVDVTNGSLYSDHTVLVKGNRIAVVGPASEVTIPVGAEIFNAEGGYLIPGLWDMHTHLLWSTDATEHLWTDMPRSLDSWTLWNRYYGPTLKLLLANGVTGIREMWGNLRIVRMVRKEASGDERLIPRMVVAGHILDGPPARWSGLVVVETPEEAREAVDSLITAGAAFLKVRNRIRPNEYRAVVQRSKDLGIPLTGHVPWLVRSTEASDAGQKSIEHLTGIVEGCSSSQDSLIELSGRILEAIEQQEGTLADSLDNRFFSLMLSTQNNSRCRAQLRNLARNGTWQVPTLVLKLGISQYLNEHKPIDDSLLKYIHPDIRASWLPKKSTYGQKTEQEYQHRMQLHKRKAEIIAMAIEERVPIMAGTDTPNPYVLPGFGLHKELELLVEEGLSPLEALQSATINPARYLNATDTLGTVEKGKLADLVLLEANPLENITNTRRIRAVLLNGQLLDRHDLNNLLIKVKNAVND